MTPSSLEQSTICKHAKPAPPLSDFITAKREMCVKTRKAIDGLVTIAEKNTDIRHFIESYICQRLRPCSYAPPFPAPVPFIIPMAPIAAGIWPAPPAEGAPVADEGSAGAPTTFMLRNVPTDWTLDDLRKELLDLGIAEGEDVDCICLVTPRTDPKRVKDPALPKPNKGYAFVNVTSPARGETLRRALLMHVHPLKVCVAKNQGTSFYRKRHYQDSVFPPRSRKGQADVAQAIQLSDLLDLSEPEPRPHTVALSPAVYQPDMTVVSHDRAATDDVPLENIVPNGFEILKALQNDGGPLKTVAVGGNISSVSDGAAQLDPDNSLALALLHRMKGCDT